MALCTSPTSWSHMHVVKSTMGFCSIFPSTFGIIAPLVVDPEEWCYNRIHGRDSATAIWWNIHPLHLWLQTKHRSLLSLSYLPNSCLGRAQQISTSYKKTPCNDFHYFWPCVVQTCAGLDLHRFLRCLKRRLFGCLHTAVFAFRPQLKLRRATVDLPSGNLLHSYWTW